MKMMMFCLFIAPCYSLCEVLVGELIFMNIIFSFPESYFSWDLGHYMSCSFLSDTMSFFLCIMTLWISALMIFTLDNFKKNKKKGLMAVISLMTILIIMFNSISAVSFFSLFELSMIPTMILIIGWGYQPERIDAYFNFFYFTSIPSIPFLMYILYFVNPCWIISLEKLNGINSMIFFLLFSLFLVKLPLYFVHFWLPKAHVEAPVSGSMILAGILLKMGGYGLIRFIPMSNFSFSFFMISSISALGMVMTCFMCLFSPDLKSIVAYSSVSHMNFMTLGLMTMKSMAMMGGLIMMIAHALSSSGMFYLCDVMYKRTSSRSLLLNKSMIIFSPLISFWWMILCVFNMAFPLSPGNLSEMFLGLTMVVNFSPMMWWVLMSYFLFSAYYSMFIYYSINHGGFVNSSLVWSLTMKENMVMICHIIPCMLLIFSSFLMNT